MATVPVRVARFEASEITTISRGQLLWLTLKR